MSEPNAKTDHATAVSQTVADKLAALNPTIMDKVVDIKVEEELKRRTDLALKGLAKLESLEKDLAKIKPDQIVKDPQTGAVIQQGMSPGKWSEKEKAEKAIKEMKDALSLALTEGKYDALKKQVEKGGGDKAEKSDD